MFLLLFGHPVFAGLLSQWQQVYLESFEEKTDHYCKNLNSETKILLG